MKRISINKFEWEAGLFVLLMLLSYSVKASLVSDSTRSELTADISLSGEYNDNVYLKSEKSPDYLSDQLFYFSPKVSYNRMLKRQRLGLSIDGNLRKGLKEVPLETNLNSLGFLDLSYGGFKVKLHDYYRQADFDLGLHDFPLINTRKSNNFDSKLSYTFGKNLTLAGKYLNRWFTYNSTAGDFLRWASEYGAGLVYHYSNNLNFKADYLRIDEVFHLPASGTLNRNANLIKSKLNFPINNSVKSYITYNYEDQNSIEREEKNFVEHQGLIGTRWDREHKAVLWMEAGYGYLQYADSSSHNYASVIGNVGFDYNISTNLKSHGSIGIDVYRKLAADFELQYKQANKIKVSIYAKRKTKKHFLYSQYGDTYIANDFGGSISTFLSEIIKLKTAIHYFTRDEFSNEYNFLIDRTIYEVLDISLTTSLKFEYENISFKGGFLQYNSIYAQELNDINRLIYVKMWGNYTIAKHYKPGVYLMYARRYAFKELNAFQNLRVGISFSYIF